MSPSMRRARIVTTPRSRCARSERRRNRPPAITDWARGNSAATAWLARRGHRAGGWAIDAVRAPLTPCASKPNRTQHALRAGRAALSCGHMSRSDGAGDARLWPTSGARPRATSSVLRRSRPHIGATADGIPGKRRKPQLRPAAAARQRGRHAHTRTAHWRCVSELPGRRQLGPTHGWAEVSVRAEAW